MPIDARSTEPTKDQQMSSATGERRNGLATRPLREYYSRVLAYLVGAATLAAGVHCQYFAIELIWMVPYTLLYPHFAYHLSYRFKRNHPERTSQVLLSLDALNAGAGIVLLGGALVPTLMFLLTLSFSALVTGSLGHLLITLLMVLVGVGLTNLLVPFQLNLETPPLVAAVSILFTTTYVCITAYLVHQQGMRLAEARREIGTEQAEAARLARNLAKYLSPQVWESIFSGERSVRLETQRKKLTVFFSDIKGFTELSEELEAEALTDLLNNYLNEMSKIVLKYGGTIDKFVGDCVMVFFGDPNSQGAKRDAVAAVSMAIAMRKHMKVLRQQWRAQGITKPM